MNENKRNQDSQLENMIYKLKIINNEIERLETNKGGRLILI